MGRGKRSAPPKPHKHRRARMNARTAAVRTPTLCAARPRTVRVAVVAKPNKALAEARTVLKKQLPKIEAAAIVGAATLTASPAFALVDKRLNGDGTRLHLALTTLSWVGSWWVFLELFGPSFLNPLVNLVPVRKMVMMVVCPCKQTRVTHMHVSFNKTRVFSPANQKQKNIEPYSIATQFILWDLKKMTSSNQIT